VVSVRAGYATWQALSVSGSGEDRAVERLQYRDRVVIAELDTNVAVSDTVDIVLRQGHRRVHQQ